MPEWRKQLVSSEETKRNRTHRMSHSEIITIWIFYHQSGYRTFKWFYQKYIQAQCHNKFPNLLSYNRFIEIAPELLVPIAVFMQSYHGQTQGIAFVDSTPLSVCKNLRIPRHKTFKDKAGRGKSSTGWFYGSFCAKWQRELDRSGNNLACFGTFTRKCGELEGM